MNTDPADEPIEPAIAPPHGRVLVAVLLLCAALLGVLVWKAVDDGRYELKVARGEARLQALVLGSSLETAFEATDHLLSSLAEAVASQPGQALTLANFRTQLLRTPHLTDLRFYRLDGSLAVRGGLRPADGSPLPDWAKHEIARARSSGFGVDHGVLGFYRQASDHDGRWIGTVMAVLDDQYFRQLYEQLPGPLRSAAALVGPDETVLMDLGNTVGGTALNNSPLFSGVSLLEVARPRSALGAGDDGLLVAHQLRTHPFRVMQALSGEALAARQRDRILASGLTGLMVCALALLFVSSWLRSARAHHRTLADLHRLNAAIEQLPNPFIIADQDARIVYANPEFTRTTGYQRGEAMGRNPRFLKSGLTPPETHRALWRTLNRGQAWRGMLLNRRKDGSVYSEEAVIAPLRNPQGHLTHYFAVKTDISERRKAEDALAAERRRLQRIIRATGAGTWELDVASGALETNPRWRELTGRGDGGEVGLEDWIGGIHEADRKAFRQALQDHLSGHTDYFEHELRLGAAAGDTDRTWLLVRGQVSDRDAGGQAQAMSGTVLDITARKSAELALREGEARYRTLVGSVKETIFQTDLDGCWTFLNPAWSELTGCSVEDCLGRPMFEFTDQAGRQRLTAALHDLISGSSESYLAEIRIARGKDGWRWCEFFARASRDSGGTASGISGTLDDVTERRQAERDLHLAASVFTHAREGIVITDRDANIIDANAAFTRITGYTREEAQGKNPRLMASGRQGEHFYREMWRRLLQQGHWEGEIWNRRKDGTVYAALLSISAVRDPGGQVLHYVGHSYDITLQKEHEAQLELIAHYDALTGLPNRVLLHDRLQQAMAQATRRHCRLAVAYIDLDGFKEINDRHGHNAGDELLVAVAKRMRESVRSEDTIARLGGDEFVALLVDLPDLQAAVPLIDRLLEAASQPVRQEDRVLQVSGSIGVTFHPQMEEHDADQLLRQADLAMYQAKLSGKNRFHVFDAEQDRSAKGHHESLDRIRRALEQDEFVLHFQPQVNMRSGRVTGAEALIRWQHPQRGLLPPAAFLPEVADHPLACELGEWVIRSTLDQVGRWLAAGLDIPVSINVAPRQLQGDDCVERLRAVMASHPEFRPGRVELEVLETSALEDMAHVAQVIEACLQMGIRFALDDFGTGYSSLTYLKRLPASRLKIDQSFVRDMLDDPDDLAILEGVMGLASAFRRDVIAEGVESVEHGRMLLQLGCEHAQGYAIARPMPGDQLPAWVAAWQPFPQWRRQAAISRDRLPVLFAQVEHRSWIRSFRAYLEGNRLAPPPLDPKHCRFGHWLSHGGHEMLASAATAADIERAHEAVHERAADLHARVAPGGSALAPEALDELHRARDELLAGLDRLLQDGAEPQA